MKKEIFEDKARSLLADNNPSEYRANGASLIFATLTLPQLEIQIAKGGGSSVGKDLLEYRNKVIAMEVSDLQLYDASASSLMVLDFWKHGVFPGVILVSDASSLAYSYVKNYLGDIGVAIPKALQALRIAKECNHWEVARALECWLDGFVSAVRVQSIESGSLLHTLDEMEILKECWERHADQRPGATAPKFLTVCGAMPWDVA